MENKLIKRLRPLVTTFSGAIYANYSHGDEISIGGRIESIFNLSAILEDEKQMVQIDIDDAVGQISILIPGAIYKYHLKKEEYKVDDIIIAKGKVYKEGFRSSNENIPILICWSIRKITEGDD